MYRHYIILGSAYSIGKRIGLDYVINSDKDFNFAKRDIKYIKKHCKNDIHLSSNFIQVDDEGWDAVVKHDGFFKNVEIIKSKKEFVELLNADKDLIAKDVARYILTKVPCTHLKLEKLVYLCYADYLCKTNKSLFTDRIYAYKLGPIATSVYNKYRKQKDVLYSEEDNKKIEDESKLYMPIRSRIMASKDGNDKIFSIDETIDKYKDLKAYELVDITHRANSPWTMVGYSEGEKPKCIRKEVIYKYHKNEI